MSYCAKCNEDKNLFPEKVIEIINECDPVLFHRVEFAATLGDDTEVPPETLDYKNVLLVYLANNHAYLYSSDGEPTLISMGELSVEKIEEQLKEMGLQISATIQRVDDLSNQVVGLSGEVKALGAAIDQNKSDTQKLQNDLATEATARANDTQKLTEDIQTVSDDLDTRTTTLQNSINNVQSNTDANTAALNNPVQLNTTLSGNGSTVTITKTIGKLTDQNTTSTDIELPVASSTQAGVMNPATFSAVQDNSENIGAILKGSVALEGIVTNPTQQQLTDSWKAATGITKIINKASIFDIDNEKNWTYYTNDDTWHAVSSSSSITISQATNTSTGIVRGDDTNTPGMQFIEPNGKMSTIGWDDHESRITNNTSEITTLKQQVAVEDTRTKNLPTQVVYNTSIPEYKANEVDLNLIVKDLHTGGDASLPLNIMGATSTKAGVMTSTQAKSLSDTASQLATTMHDVDDALGDIATIQADYIGKSNIKTVSGQSLLGVGTATPTPIYNATYTNNGLLKLDETFPIVAGAIPSGTTFYVKISSESGKILVTEKPIDMAINSDAKNYSLTLNLATRNNVDASTAYNAPLNQDTIYKVTITGTSTAQLDGLHIGVGNSDISKGSLNFDRIDKSSIRPIWDTLYISGYGNNTAGYILIPSMLGDSYVAEVVNSGDSVQLNISSDINMVETYSRVVYSSSGVDGYLRARRLLSGTTLYSRRIFNITQGVVKTQAESALTPTLVQGVYVCNVAEEGGAVYARSNHTIMSRVGDSNTWHAKVEDNCSDYASAYQGFVTLTMESNSRIPAFYRANSTGNISYYEHVIKILRP